MNDNTSIKSNKKLIGHLQIIGDDPLVSLYIDMDMYHISDRFLLLKVNSDGNVYSKPVSIKEVKQYINGDVSIKELFKEYEIKNEMFFIDEICNELSKIEYCLKVFDS